MSIEYKIFNKITNIINKSPNGLLMDLLESILYEYNKKYYKKIIDLCVSDKITKYIKMNYIEIICKWDKIKIKVRIKDLEKMKKINNDYVIISFIDDTIKDLRSEII